MFRSSSESCDQSASVPKLNYFMLAVLEALLVIAGVEMNPGPVNNGKVPEAAEKTFTKTTGHADMRGELYEVKVATLLLVRALNRGGDFHLASNMAAGGAFDDIVLRLGQKPMFLQLKHRTGISKINKSQLVQLRGNFSLLKYYKSYCEMRQQWAQKEDLQHCGRFEDAIFVIYTNATIDPSLVTQVDTTDDWRHFLNTGMGMCHNFNEQSNPEFFEFLKNIPEYIKVLNDAIDGKQPLNLLATVRILLNNNVKSLPNQEELRKMLKELPSLSDVSDHREFLSRLWLLTGQASEEELDDLIKMEIVTSIGRDLVYDKFQAEVQKWWKDSNLYLTNNIRFWQEIVQSGIANISDKKLKEIGLGIAFNKDECVLVRTFLMFFQTLHIIPEATTASTILSCLKVHNSLGSECHLLVDGSTFQSHWNEVLALWGRWCDFLVVVEAGNVDMDALTDILHKSPHKRLVLVGGSDTWHRPQHTYATLNDHVTLRQLDEASHARVLAALVHFQGYDVVFGEIAGSFQDLVSADVIFQLLKDKPVLGHALTGDLDYYIPRSLRIEGKVKEEVTSHGQTMLPKPSCVQNDSFIVENLDSIMDVCQPVVLVSAMPGIGKSTLLTHLALGTKEAKPVMWVVRVNLNDFTRQLDQLPKEIELHDAIEFLMQFSGIAPEWKPMFRWKLATMENVCVLFDGYDEISPTHSEKVTKLLKILQATKLQKLWVTTRPVMREELERVLSTLSLTLQPFSESDQRNFLTKYWKKSIPHIEEPLLNKFITELLHLTARNLNDRDNELMGIPLQSMMLAEAFEKDLRTYSETCKLELLHKLDLLQLYDKFVDRKFEIYYEKNKLDLTKPGQIEVYEQWKETVQENHMLSALIVLLPRDELNFEGIQTIKDKIKFFSRSAAVLRNKGISAHEIEVRVQLFFKKVSECHENTGIIHAIVNSKPVFIHRTFAEYFAALWFARNFENLKSYLNEKLFDPNFQIVRNFFDLILAQKFPLHVAVLKQDKGSVETLLEQQNDFNARDKGGRTTLHMAVMSYIGTPDNNLSSRKTMKQIMEILLKHGADPGIEDEVLCWRPLRIAERISAWSVVDMLLANRTDSKDLVLIKKNINNEVYIQIVLRAAARQGLVNLVASMLQCGLSVGHRFVVHCGRINCKATLLHESARHGQVKLVRFLLDKKADIKATDSCFERSALMWAAEKGQLEVVELLIQRGASVTSRDGVGNTALLLAARIEHWDVFRLLSQQRDTDVTACDIRGCNALHLAAASGSAEIVAQLLDTGQFDIDCCDKERMTPLWLAAYRGRLEVTQLLCERGADLNVQDIPGWTPLNIAAYYGHLQIVQFLVQNGASLTARDKEGQTPLGVAVKEGISDVADFLRNITQ